jgi:hypothetical protein
MSIPAVFPEGHVHWFYRFFKCFGKRVKLDGIEDKYYTVIFNRYVYTTDGKFFYGYYTPDAAEDLDPFSMMPPDFVFCCQCCCYICCRCYREKYNKQYEKEADLFFGKDKEPLTEEPKEESAKPPSTDNYITWKFIDDSVESFSKV